MDLEKEFKLDQATRTFKIHSKMAGNYMIRIFVGYEQGDIFSSPEENNLPLNSYKHFSLHIKYIDKNRCMTIDEMKKEGFNFTGCQAVYNTAYLKVPQNVIERAVNHAYTICGQSIQPAQLVSNGGVCFKCNQFDGYAAPSPKHNGKIVCYKCFS